VLNPPVPIPNTEVKPRWAESEWVSAPDCLAAASISPGEAGFQTRQERSVAEMEGLPSPEKQLTCTENEYCTDNVNGAILLL
jgi:hypothetical protein